MTVSSTRKFVENTNGSPSKGNMNHTGQKKSEESSLLIPLQPSVFNDPNKPIRTLLNNNMKKYSDEQINFVGMCRENFKSELPTDFDQWTIEQQYDHLTNNVDKYFPNIPVSLRYMLPGIFKDGDCGRPISERPNWLDMDKFRRGQTFARRYFASICLAQLMSLFEIFSFSDGLKILIMSQKSNTPYRAFQRYLSTVLRVKHWYEEDPWDERTRAHQDIKAVRKMHLAMRRKLCSYDDEQIDANSRITHPYISTYKAIVEDFRETCPAMGDLHCPFTMMKYRSINQGDMTCTQNAFMGRIVLHPKKFGIYNVCDEDLEAFCHMWRGIGYLLGIEDRYNFCRGSLEEIRTRIKDINMYWFKPNLLTVTPEWEHMSICLYKGLGYFLPIMNYKIYLLYVCDILEFNMPRLYGSMSLVEKMLYVCLKFLFIYLTRLPIVVDILNLIIHRRLKQAMNFGPKKHSELKRRSSKFEIKTVNL